MRTEDTGSERTTGFDRSDLRRGGIVVVVGLWLLASIQGVRGFDFSDSWPFLLILIGAVMAIFPASGRGSCRDRGRWGGVMMMIWGGLAFVAVRGLWGFGWFNIWPLFLVVVGLEMVVNALVQQRRSRHPDTRGRAREPHDA